MFCQKAKLILCAVLVATLTTISAQADEFPAYPENQVSSLNCLEGKSGCVIAPAHTLAALLETTRAQREQRLQFMQERYALERTERIALYTSILGQIEKILETYQRFELRMYSGQAFQHIVEHAKKQIARFQPQIPPEHIKEIDDVEAALARSYEFLISAQAELAGVMTENERTALLKAKTAEFQKLAQYAEAYIGRAAWTRQRYITQKGPVVFETDKELELNSETVHSNEARIYKLSSLVPETGLQPGSQMGGPISYAADWLLISSKELTAEQNAKFLNLNDVDIIRRIFDGNMSFMGPLRIDFLRMGEETAIKKTTYIFEDNRIIEVYKVKEAKMGPFAQPAKYTHAASKIDPVAFLRENLSK